MTKLELIRLHDLLHEYQERVVAQGGDDAQLVVSWIDMVRTEILADIRRQDVR